MRSITNPIGRLPADGSKDGYRYGAQIETCLFMYRSAVLIVRAYRLLSTARRPTALYQAKGPLYPVKHSRCVCIKSVAIAGLRSHPELMKTGSSHPTAPTFLASVNAGTMPTNSVRLSDMATLGEQTRRARVTRELDRTALLLFPHIRVCTKKKTLNPSLELLSAVR